MKALILQEIRLFKLFKIRMRLWLVLLTTFVLAGCLSGPVSKLQKECTELPAMENGGRLSVFMNLERAGVQHQNITVSLIEMLVGDAWLPISEQEQNLDTEEIGKNQAFLGSRVMPSGIYERFRITVARAVSLVDGKKMALKLPNPVFEVRLSSPLKLEFKTNAVLLLSWDADSDLTSSNMTSPEIFRASHSQVAHVASNKAYVSCPEIDTVYVIRTDKNWVQDSFAISGRPTYMTADSDSKKLYILAEDEARIKIVDMVSLLVVEEIKIPMTRTPIFMTMMPDHSSAYIIDDLGNIVKMDVRNGLMLARKRVGERPVSATYLNRQEKLVVSSTEDRTLYFVDPDTLETLETLVVSGSPSGVLEWENYLYIAESETGVVSLYDLNERKIVKSLSVGYSPERLANDGDSIFVTNELDSSVSFMQGGQFYVNKTLPVSGSTGEMAIAHYHRLLYVGNGGCDGNLAVIDLTSRRIIGKIDLGAKPHGIAVIQ